MPIFIDPRQETEFVLERERGKPDATRFHLKALTAHQRMEIKDRATIIGPGPDGTPTVVGIRVQSMLYDYAAAAITAVDGGVTESGKPFRFRRGDLSSFTEADIKEIGVEVQRLNEVDEVEAKN